MEDLSVYFVTTKPTLWQRIKGWWQRLMNDIGAAILDSRENINL